MYEDLREKIAGEIVLSTSPGQTIRKWRELFRVSQRELGAYLKITPSVLSDYECSRRKKPGTVLIKKIVNGLIAIDVRRGGLITKQYQQKDSDAILSTREFPVGISAPVFMKAIRAENLCPEISLLREIFGYTIIDSLKAITTFEPADYLRMFGRNSERALMFTGVNYGRSPMIAIRTQVIKPAMVVYIRPKQVDELAIRLAELENIIFVKTNLHVNRVIDKLEKL